MTPVETGRLRRVHGGWRADRVVGATVYNEGGERIGTVDDLIIGRDSKISAAVLSVGGFLGLGSKLVVVPYEQLQFEERTEDRAGSAPAPQDATRRPGAAPTTAAPGAVPAPALPPVVTVRLVLPGTTRDSLRALPEFDYN